MIEIGAAIVCLGIGLYFMAADSSRRSRSQMARNRLDADAKRIRAWWAYNFWWHVHWTAVTVETLAERELWRA